MINILIADDHSVVREGLKQIISGNADMTVLAEACSGNEAIEKIRKNPISVAILDISMPGKNGLDTLKELKVMHPDLPVLILSMYPEEQYALRFFRAGASGYLTKKSAPEELVTAIRTVSRGKKYVSPVLAEKLIGELDVTNEKPLHSALSDREFQVLCLMASGKTSGEIAEELFLSVKTISTYRARILEKLRLKNTAELINYAIQNQLVE
ncbi:MAG: response regulator transcription factor [Thermodesulfovibrionales bacterium]